MRRTLAYAVFALPIVIASTITYAQQTQQTKPKQMKNQMSDEAIEARKECFSEAQTRYPGNDQASVGLARNREVAYRDCANRKGIRP